MIKMKSGLLAILLITCMVLSSGLFGCTRGSSDGAGSGEQSQEGDSAGGGSDASISAPKGEWVLPIIISITGNDADAGLAAAWGFDYGVKVVNEHGGILGMPASISIRDAASSGLGVVSEIDFAAPEALVIVGPANEELYDAGASAFSRAGLPTVGAATNEENREANSPFAISCITDPDSEAVSAIEAWTKVERFSKPCLIYSSESEDRTESAEEALLALGKDVVEKVEVDGAAFNAPIVAETAFANNPDAFYIDTGGEEALRIIKQLKFVAGDNASKLKILCGPQLADLSLIESDADGDLHGVRVWSTLDPNKDAEKRKAFEEAYEKNLGDLAYYRMAIDYYQSALLLEQSIEKLALTGAPEVLSSEREALANYLYNTDLIITDQGDFIIVNGSKLTVSKLYRITEKGFQ